MYFWACYSDIFLNKLHCDLICLLFILSTPLLCVDLYYSLGNSLIWGESFFPDSLIRILRSFEDFYPLSSELCPSLHYLRLMSQTRIWKESYHSGRVFSLVIIYLPSLSAFFVISQKKKRIRYQTSFLTVFQELTCASLIEIEPLYWITQAILSGHVIQSYIFQMLHKQVLPRTRTAIKHKTQPTCRGGGGSLLLDCGPVLSKWVEKQ